MVFGLRKKKKYEFKCSSIGMNCGFVVKNASTEEEVVEILKVHAKRAHTIDQVSPELANKIRQNIRKV